MKNQISYWGDDLGAVYHPTHTTFRLWAPTAEDVTFCRYEAGDGDCLLEEIPMHPDVQGTWFLSMEGEWDHTYYTYKIRRGDKWVESQDPYAVAAGVNGVRSMVLNLRKTDPQGFSKDHGPKKQNRTDLVICEISVADMTADPSAGVKHKGKFLGLAESGTKNADGEPTGLDYLRSLGITHVQIMPSYDFASIDESQMGQAQYNWGYDPLNYNVPEGSYSTDPFHGEVRVREFKEMVAAFHSAGLGVIMDVVFNHTYDLNSCLQKCEPDYYYRKVGKTYSDASACGNEIASERPMMHKYIVDSVCYWAKEYHLDGFRFDLMGVLDVDTLNDLSVKLREINPAIVLYGEGWTGGPSPLPECRRALKKNVRMLDGIGMFSDDIRDAIRGHIFYNTKRGFVAGQEGYENAVRYSVTGAVWHPQVDYDHYTYSEDGPWAATPCDTISYASCHDNLTLWDKFLVSCPEKSVGERMAMNRLAAAMVFTAQGTPFFLSGEEFARTKPVEGSDEVSENSYNLPLFTNALSYTWSSQQKELQAYYRGLIAFRKAHRGLRLTTAEEVRKEIDFLEELPANVVAFTISREEETLFVVYNANETSVTLSLPAEGEWERYIDEVHAGTQSLGTAAGAVEVPKVSCAVYTQKH
jgi:pullulanase